MCDRMQVHPDTHRTLLAHYDTSVGNFIGLTVTYGKAWVDHPSLPEPERFQVT
jgi:hypothetical protein